MTEPITVYYNFRKAQAESKNRGFRMPKDFEKHLESKFTKKNRDALELAAKYFSTKWQNINIYDYMECGFELYKTFTYTKFFDPKVMRLYIEKDKNKKREMDLNKEKIVGSVKFIKKYMAENKLFLIRDYCEKKEGNKKIIILHYLNNNIDKYLFVWLMKNNYLFLNDDDRGKIPYIIEQYREISETLKEIDDFMDKIRKNL